MKVALFKKDNKSTAVSKLLAVLAIAAAGMVFPVAPSLADLNKTKSYDLSRTVGGLTVYPVLNLSLGYRTDVFQEDGGVSGSPILDIMAGGGVQGEHNEHLYGAEYLVETGYYFDGPDDNNVDQRLIFYGGTMITPRHNIDAGLEFKDAHDPRGQDDVYYNIRDTIGVADPDEWRELQGGATYTLGVPGARGKVELGGCYTCKEYDNNDQDYRNVDTQDLGATLYMKLGGKTYGFVQMVVSDFDYVDQPLSAPTNGVELDSRENRYMVGANWKYSEKTLGLARIGQVEKTFDDDTSRSDYDSLSWDMALLWAPTTRDQVTATYFSAPRESVPYDGDEQLYDFVETQAVDLSWSRSLGARFQAQAGGHMGWENFQPDGHEDDRTGYSLGVQYNLPGVGSVGITYFRDKRDSTLPGNSYDDEGIALHFNIGALFGFGVNNSRAPAICTLRSFGSGMRY